MGIGGRCESHLGHLGPDACDSAMSLSPPRTAGVRIAADAVKDPPRTTLVELLQYHVAATPDALGDLGGTRPGRPCSPSSPRLSRLSADTQILAAQPTADVSDAVTGFSDAKTCFDSIRHSGTKHRRSRLARPTLA